jgi:hypothetical protein
MTSEIFEEKVLAPVTAERYCMSTGFSTDFWAMSMDRKIRCKSVMMLQEKPLAFLYLSRSRG